MSKLIRSGTRFAALVLLVGLGGGGSPSRGADARSPEIWDPEYLQGLLKSQEEALAGYKPRLKIAEDLRASNQRFVQLCEKAHKEALERLAELKTDPERDERVLKDAEDHAELTDLELGTRRKDLLAASSYREAVLAHGAELETYIAMVRSKLKALENQGEADWDEFLNARERYARSFLRGARADQTEAECGLEAAESKVVAARKKVAISKAKVMKAKEMLEKANQDGKGPRLAAANPASPIDARLITPRARKVAD